MRCARPLAALLCGVVPLLGPVCEGQPTKAGSPEQVDAEFSVRYAAWRDYVLNHRADYALVGSPLQTEEGWRLYQRLTDLGLPALPALMRRMEDGDALLAAAASQITKRRFERADFGGPRVYGDQRAIAELLVEWWRSGDPGVRQRFDALWEEWQRIRGAEETLLWTEETVLDGTRGELRTRRKAATRAGEVLDSIRSLGIAALPHIVATLSEGEADLLPVALEFTKGAEISAHPEKPPRVEEFLVWWETNKQDWLIPWPEEDGEE